MFESFWPLDQDPADNKTRGLIVRIFSFPAAIFFGALLSAIFFGALLSAVFFGVLLSAKNSRGPIVQGTPGRSRQSCPGPGARARGPGPETGPEAGQLCPDLPGVPRTIRPREKVADNRTPDFLAAGKEKSGK